jgi:orotate phosphoribosyltransferase
MDQAVPIPKPVPAAPKQKARLLEIIKKKSLLTEGGPFKLASGGMSDYYLDLKPTSFDAEGSALIAEIVYGGLHVESGVDAIGGLELGAVPIVAAICAYSAGREPVAGFVVRKDTKGHGTDKKIDGNFKPNSRVVLIEDVTTRGGSVMQAVHAVRDKGATVTRVITIVDRLEGATDALKREGIELQAVFTRHDLLGQA